MRTKLMIVALGLMVAGGVALAQPAAPQGPMGMARHERLFYGLKLTDQQKTDAHKIWFDLRQKQIDVRAKMQHARLDYEALASADKPDQKAIASKLQEMGDLRVQLQQNKLESWFAVNKILTPEQQKIWKRVLQHPMMAQHSFRAGMREKVGRMMNRMNMMDHGCMMQGRDFGPGGMHPGMNRPAPPSNPGN